MEKNQSSSNILIKLFGIVFRSCIQTNYRNKSNPILKRYEQNFDYALYPIYQLIYQITLMQFQNVSRNDRFKTAFNNIIMHHDVSYRTRKKIKIYLMTKACRNDCYN